MIYQRLYRIEHNLRKEKRKNEVKLAAVDRIKDYLLGIDLDMEWIHLKDLESWMDLMTELKGDELTKMERFMAEEIFHVDRSDKNNVK